MPQIQTNYPHRATSDRPFPDALKGILLRSSARKTLILCPIGLGNFLMATPGLIRLSNAIGRENLHLLALKDSIKSLAEATSLFGFIHAWDPDKQSKASGLKLLGNVRREAFDFSISLFPSSNWRFSVFAALIGAKNRIGFAYPNDKLPNFVQTISAPLNMSAHDTDQNSDLIDALVGNESTSRRELIFPYPPTHLQTELLAREKYYVCHPGSSAERGMKEKRLPPEAFAKIIMNIYREFGIKCVLIGGPEEGDLREAIAERSREAVLHISSKSFSELAELIEGAGFYLGNDSGLMHVSVALNKRCIAFFGPTDEQRTGPYADTLRSGSSPHLIVRREDLECAPCWTIQTIGKNPPCIYGDTRCLRQLNVNAVWPKIKEFVQNLQVDTGAAILESV